MTKKERRDIYQEVTDKIVAALEAGTIPWHKPWKNLKGDLPYSLSTGKPYRGINVFTLALSGYSDPRWGTYKAIGEAGGQVRKGEKGTRIILWKRFTKKGVDENGEPNKPYVFLTDYVVFNAEQADGLPELETEELPEHDLIEEGEKLIQGYVDSTRKYGKSIKAGPALNFGGNRAFYNLTNDRVTTPLIGQFETPEEYYSTNFHELVHSTGHKDRLDRLEPATFGSDPYAREELVAELGASLLAGVIGLEIDGDNSAAYLAGWVKTLKGDPKMVVQAAAAAQKAADLILGTTFDEQPVDLAQAA